MTLSPELTLHGRYRLVQRIAVGGGPQELVPPRPVPGRRQVMNGMIRIATMFATLIIGLIAGPAVSL